MWTCVLALLALQVVLSQCFSWDMVFGVQKRLEFYNNGTPTHIERIEVPYDITAVTYDPVHDRILFAFDSPDVEIYRFDLSPHTAQFEDGDLPRTTKLIMIPRGRPIYSLAYDPVTELLFWFDFSVIYSLSLNPDSSDESNEPNHLIVEDEQCLDIAVDSCEGFVYWITDYSIERVRFDGSKRETLIVNYEMAATSLIIDPQTRNMFWIERGYASKTNQLELKSADLNGKDIKTVYSFRRNTDYASSLTVSKDYIYWYGHKQKAIGRLLKMAPKFAVQQFLVYNLGTCQQCQRITTKYLIQEQTQGIKICDALKGLPSYHSQVPDSTSHKVDKPPVTTSDGPLCIHGTKNSGDSRCKCAQGYSGDRCDIRNCHNFCFQGKCFINDKGKPNCRCRSGYSGKRCRIHTKAKLCVFTGAC